MKTNCSPTSLAVIVVSFAMQAPVLECNDTFSPVSDSEVGELYYKKLPRELDRERRLQRINDNAGTCDVEALSGMPNAYVRAITDYTQEILLSIHAVPLSRPRFFCSQTLGQIPFPLAAHASYDRDIKIQVAILPRPEAVIRWADSVPGREAGWRPMEAALKDPYSVYGKSVVFDRGIVSENPNAGPALPYEVAFSSGLFVKGKLILRIGKLVTSPRYSVENREVLQDMTTDLALGRPEGAKLRGQFFTTMPFLGNSRLRWVCIQKGENVRRFLAYALVDGNGACRRDPSNIAPNEISQFVRPLACPLHQPKVRQHDELLLPTPLPWPESWASSYEYGPVFPREDWCLDDWFPAQKDACWLIRESEDSRPLEESFLLMPASEESERPVFFIALFAETEPKQLVKELAALYKVSPDTALNSPETMQQLNSLYEKVRDFPLGK